MPHTSTSREVLITMAGGEKKLVYSRQFIIQNIKSYSFNQKLAGQEGSKSTKEQRNWMESAVPAFRAAAQLPNS